MQTHWNILRQILVSNANESEARPSIRYNSYIRIQSQKCESD